MVGGLGGIICSKRENIDAHSLAHSLVRLREGKDVQEEVFVKCG